jgi:hypothetical protein
MILIILFVLFIVLLKVMFFDSISLNMIVIATSVLALVMIVLFKNRITTETFNNLPNQEQTSDDINKIKFLNTLLTPQAARPVPSNRNIEPVATRPDDTPTSIARNLQFLLTTYSDASYSGTGSVWYNIAAGSGGEPSQHSTAQGSIITRDFTFSTEPVFQNSKGFFLGGNVLTGPPSYSLGINGSGEFTFFVVCQHYDLPPNTIVDLFKLYGNTSNNNGLTVSLQSTGSDPVQTGRFSLAFADKAYTSTLQTPLDVNVVYLYMITKSPSTISITMMSNINPQPTEVFTSKLTTPDVLFSNKNMVMNGDGKWHAYVKCFGAYDHALNHDDMASLYAYVMTQEKQKDKFYTPYKNRIAQLSNSVVSMQSCPYGHPTSKVCAACTTVKDWSKAHNVLVAPDACKTAIGNFCGSNTTHADCACWDKTGAAYHTRGCQYWRNVFAPASASAPSPAQVAQKPPRRQVARPKGQQLEIDLEEDPATGDLLTVGIVPPASQRRPIKVVADKPDHHPANYLSTPEAPTPTGFWAWLTSWF